ncbi:hypothetical protein Tco_0900520 [Tanacetum coccineum]
MLLPKEDNVNTRKQGLGFENQNEYVNPSLLNTSKELAPCLYNIDEMGKDEFSDHKIISEENLKCEAEKRLKVKQIKSPLSYHGFVYVETQFEEPPKVPLKRRNVNLKEHLEQAMLKFEKQTFSIIELNQGDLFRMRFEQSINERVRNRLSEEFEPLVKNVNLQLNCFEKSLVKEMKDDLKYVTFLEDEFDESCLILDIQQEFFKTQFQSLKLKSYSHVDENQIVEQNSSLENEKHFLKETISQIQKDLSNLEAQFDFDETETQNIEFEHQVASLTKENEHLKLVCKNLFDSIKKSRVQTQSSNVSQNETENLKSQLSEFADKKFDNVFQKIESMKKKKFESQISNDFLQKSLYDDPSNVESESEEKKIIFGNETSSFETKIKELGMTLTQ